MTATNVNSTAIWRWLIICILGSALFLMSCSEETSTKSPTLHESNAGSSSPRNRHLPTICRHLEREPEYDSWDPVTETYPRNHEWEKCMGVY